MDGPSFQRAFPKCSKLLRSRGKKQKGRINSAIQEIQACAPWKTAPKIKGQMVGCLAEILGCSAPALVPEPPLVEDLVDLTEGQINQGKAWWNGMEQVGPDWT